MIPYFSERITPMNFLRDDCMPEYLYSHFRYFEPGEKHITRYCEEDVLLLIMEGTLRFTENGIPMEIHPGEYYIQKSGLFQTGAVPSDKPTYFYIHFHGQWDDQTGIPKRGIFDRALVSEMEKLTLLNNINASYLSKSAAFLSILSSLTGSEKLTSAQKLTTEVKRLLTDHLQHGISADEMAAQLNFSKNYIIRIFSNETGTTPHRYLNHLRIKKAEQLLNYSDLSVEKIAEECGFSCYSGFYRAFFAENTVSPREYSRNREKHTGLPASSGHPLPSKP